MSAARGTITSLSPCYNCGGIEVIPIYNSNTQQEETIICPVCNGTGYVEYTTTIREDIHVNVTVDRRG